MARTKESYFVTRITHFYKCNADMTYHLYDVKDISGNGTLSDETFVTIATNNLTIKPYKDATGMALPSHR